MHGKDRKYNFMAKSDHQGFSLVEMIIAVSILAILLGVMVPSLNSVLGFRVQRTANSIAGALDKTRIEAMSRLVGEMKLEKRSDGYYISYYIDRGKDGENVTVTEDQAEKIAPSRMVITYTTDDSTEQKNLEEGKPLVITYDRATGGFLPLQDPNRNWNSNTILKRLGEGKDINLKRNGPCCTSITVKGGFRISTISMHIDSGKYSINAGWMKED